jgi:hypothetical protein
MGGYSTSEGMNFGQTLRIPAWSAEEYIDVKSTEYSPYCWIKSLKTFSKPYVDLDQTRQ